ncbi:MAG: Rpn family recombination-promoting nuclease/putative transposase, partial [Boseongicola sp. SB0662_bin_57]|nr:Rpn family recombination-promoting nuclease/putative transposase [Boseongicola sp. SB0662_bin_57]
MRWPCHPDGGFGGLSKSRRKERSEAIRRRATRRGSGGGAPVRNGQKSDAVLPFRKHDALFRQIVSDPRRARAFLQDHLPPEYVDWLDLDKVPEQAEGS